MPRCWVWYSSPRQPPSAQLALPTRLQPSPTASAPPCKQNLVSKQLALRRRRAQASGPPLTAHEAVTSCKPQRACPVASATSDRLGPDLCTQPGASGASCKMQVGHKRQGQRLMARPCPAPSPHRCRPGAAAVSPLSALAPDRRLHGPGWGPVAASLDHLLRSPAACSTFAGSAVSGVFADGGGAAAASSDPVQHWSSSSHQLGPSGAAIGIVCAVIVVLLVAATVTHWLHRSGRLPCCNKLLDDTADGEAGRPSLASWL